MSVKRLEQIDLDLKRYLLGQLPEQQLQRIEEQVFADDDANEGLLAIEEDLIDAYVGGELSTADRASFENYFLRSERRVQKLAMARALAAALPPTAAREPSSAGRPHQWTRIVWFATAASLAVAAAVWFALRNDRQAPQSPQTERPAAGLTAQPERPVAPSPPKDQMAGSGAGTTSPPRAEAAPSPPAPPGVVSLTLVPGSSRDIAAGTRLTIPPGASLVVAELRFERVDHSSFVVVLRTVDDRVVRTVDNLRAKAEGNQMSVTVRWPATDLSDNDYLVTLSGVRSTGEREEIADYYFRAVRPPPGP